MESHEFEERTGRNGKADRNCKEIKTGCRGEGNQNVFNTPIKLSNNKNSQIRNKN